MDDGAGGRCFWSLDGTLGSLTGGALAVRVDVTHPELGLRDLHVGGDRLAGRWLCVRREAESPSQTAEMRDAHSWPLPLAEAYVRGADLVASYQASNDWPYSPQIYWRAGPLDSVPGVAGSLSLLVSVQTHLLDTHPRIVVDSKLLTKSTIQLTAGSGERAEPVTIGHESTIRATRGTCCVLQRCVGQPLSYAEFMPASDFRTALASREDDGNCNVQWQLFAEFLEKGVIRRARVHGAFLYRENDVATAMACCEAIERDALPLTT